MAKTDTQVEPTNFPADALSLTNVKYPKADEHPFITNQRITFLVLE